MSEVTRHPQPLILIRGFGGLNTNDEKKDAYQGFTEGSVYPQKQGENYIYEGLLLRFIKSNWQYQDATNVVGYYGSKIGYEPNLPGKLQYLKDIKDDSKLTEKLRNLKNKGILEQFERLQQAGYFSGSKVVINPGMALNLLESMDDPCRSIWVFRYYDLNDREFKVYGEALVRLIDFIRELAVMKNGDKPKVNIIAHSMGGLLAREAVQRTYPNSNNPRKAEDYINKIVTLGTPHRGVTFQLIKDWIDIESADDFKHFNPEFQDDKTNDASFWNFGKHFPVERLLTVVGTNYRSYGSGIATALNRFFSAPGEYGPNYNRSDGLVKQISAQIPGAPRTFINKCHGGFDSLISSRESFEVATRFLFGNVQTRLRFVKGNILRGKDWFGKSEFFMGVSIKPRGVDFELFHQSKEAENCYGPFGKEDMTDDNLSFDWADGKNLVWEGYLDTLSIMEDDYLPEKDMVFRLDFYVGERDLLGLGFSDNVIFRKQYYVRALLTKRPLELYLYTNERFAQPDLVDAEDAPVKMNAVNGGWEFEVKGTGFNGTFRIEIDAVPEVGKPQAFA
jgi:PGAP1-like protein